MLSVNQLSAAGMTYASDEKWRPFNCFFSRVGLRTYQHSWYLLSPTCLRGVWRYNCTFVIGNRGPREILLAYLIFIYLRFKLRDLYCSPDINRVIKSARMRRAVAYGTYGEGRGAHRVLVGKSKEKRPLGRPRCRWEGNIIVGFSRNRVGVDWIDLVEDRDIWRAVVNTVMNLQIP